MFYFFNLFFGVVIVVMLLGEGLGLFDYVGVVIIVVGILVV